MLPNVCDPAALEAPTEPGTSRNRFEMLRPLMGRFAMDCAVTFDPTVASEVLTTPADAVTVTVSQTQPAAPPLDGFTAAVFVVAGGAGGVSAGTSTRRGSPPSVTTRSSIATNEVNCVISL